MERHRKVLCWWMDMQAEGYGQMTVKVRWQT
jgi:hypothetical protein